MFYKNISPFHTHDLSQYSFLVTGGAGFIGSHLVEYLLTHQAKKVRVLDNLMTGFEENTQLFKDFPNFEFIQGDIRDLDTCQNACKGINYVFHEAALGSVPRSIDNPILTNEVNVQGFLNMLVASKEQNIKRFIYAASSSTYGDSPILPKQEEVIGKPLSPYAVTKYVNELYADVFYKTYGLETIGLRYFNIFGIRQSPKGAYAAVMPLFMEAIKNNTSPNINGDGLHTRDFTFVANAVQANILACFVENKDAINQVYNVAVGQSNSLLDIVDILCELAGKNIKPNHRAERLGDVKNSLADISKIQKLLNYNPTFDLKKGLSVTWEWFNSIKKV